MRSATESPRRTAGAEPRHYLDVDAIRASGRFSDDQLVASAAERDAGFEVEMFVQQLAGVLRISPTDVDRYGMTADQLEAIKTRFTQWATDLGDSPPATGLGPRSPTSCAAWSSGCGPASRPRPPRPPRPPGSVPVSDGAGRRAGHRPGSGDRGATTTGYGGGEPAPRRPVHRSLDPVDAVGAAPFGALAERHQLCACHVPGAT